MKKIFQFVCRLFLIWLILINTASAQEFPVVVNSFVSPPYSVFINDYTDLGSQKWQLQLTFRDFQEPGRSVFLRLYLEGNDMAIQTSQNYIPLNSIYLTPGIPVTLSGEDLAHYLAWENVDVIGIDPEILQKNGKLPEGHYSFCAEVIDQFSGELLSLKTCSPIWLQLNDPPTVITPVCGTNINPDIPVNIPIQWQLRNTLSAAGLGTEYQMALYEVIGDEDPQFALSNGNVIRVYESFWQQQNLIYYTIAEPALTPGKTYVFTIQARDIGGRDQFKNDGFSEICWFTYGYKEGGEIDLLEPVDSNYFKKRDKQYFRWSTTSNLMPGQKISYNLKVTEIDSNQTADEAIYNDPWHEATTPETYSNKGWDYEIKKNEQKFKPGQRYAWQVKAITGNQTVAESPVYTFLAPAVLENFYVNEHVVEVEQITSPDLAYFSGTGKVSIDSRGRNKVAVIFTGINLNREGELYYMTTGIVGGQLKDSLSIPLSPDIEENGKAIAWLHEIKLTQKHDLQVKASVNWEIPLVSRNNNSKIYTDKNWLGYSTYEMRGELYVGNRPQFELADPFGFGIELNDSSLFRLSGSQYAVNLTGGVLLPRDIESGIGLHRVTIPFKNSNQLFYMKNRIGDLATAISVSGTRSVTITPLSYIIDFTDHHTPTEISKENYWKGIVFTEFSVNLMPKEIDGPVMFRQASSINLRMQHSESNHCWIDASGIDMQAIQKMAAPLGFAYNTFDSNLDEIHLQIQGNAITESYFSGSLQVPILSENEYFQFKAPFDQTGFQTGYLTSDLTNRTFTFNKDGGEQEMEFTLRRAVFADNEKLDMTVDINWPAMQTQMKFVDGFQAWGNYDVGFHEPNGVTPLAWQSQGSNRGYYLSSDYLGIGRDKDLYSVGMATNMAMGKTISGATGAPVVNAFSTTRNKLIKERSHVRAEDENGNRKTNEDIFKETTSAGIEIDQSGLNPEISKLIDDYNKTFNTPVRTYSQNFQPGNNSFAIDRSFSENFSAENTENTLSIEKILNWIEILITFSDEENRQKLEKLKSILTQLDSSEIADILRELQDRGGTLSALLEILVDKAVAGLNNEIDRQGNKIKGKIQDFIHSKVNSVNAKIDSLVAISIDRLVKGSINLVPEEKAEEAKKLIIQSGEIVKRELSQELNAALLASIDDNVTNKITGLIDTTILFRIKAFIEVEIQGVGYAIINKEMTGDSLNAVKKRGIHVLGTIGKDLEDQLKTFNLKNVSLTVINIGEDFYKNIDWADVGTRIANGIANEAILALVKDKLVKGLTSLAGGDENGIISGITTGVINNVSLDMSNMGQKVRTGDLGGIINFQTANIRIETKVVKLVAKLSHIPDDPDYGDTWQAEVTADVLKPKEFTVKGRYLQGKINGFEYWFVEVAIPEKLNVPLIPGVLLMDGIGGKVFHHMNFNMEKRTYLPADTVKYGAGLDIYCIDINSQGDVLRMKVTAELVLYEDYFTLGIRGDAGIGFPKTDKRPPFTGAVANGFGDLTYNSKNDHLLGAFTVKTNTAPVICAGGELGIDIRQGSWRVYIGQQTNMVSVKLLCSNKIMMGAWVDVSNTRMNMGLVQKIDIYGQTPWLKITGSYRGLAYAQFKYDFDARTSLTFQPKFLVNNASIYISALAQIGVKWQKYKKGKVKNSGTKNFVSVHIYGNATYVNTSTRAAVAGKLGGRVKVFGIGFPFNLKVDKDIKT